MATVCPRGLMARGLRLSLSNRHVLHQSLPKRHIQSELSSSPRPRPRSTPLQRPLAAELTRPRDQAILPSFRPFSHSSPAQRKKDTKSKKSQPTAADPPSSAPDADDSSPLDLAALSASYGPIDAHFRSQLQLLARGGRFNPDSLGALPVAVKPSADDASHGGSGGGGETFPLRELAQVVPRAGRAVSLLLNDRAYVKPVMSAVQASPDFNQQPQRAEGSDLELVLRVEPERREDVARRVREACQTWRERVRHARVKHDKAIRDWRKTNPSVPADAVRRADREMQKLQDGKMREIEQAEAQTVKMLDRNG